ncbi:T9SS type A sorting domain-containing protein [Winogradskyella ludwigii]|uniref:T9SS type A sorting domain-containing protein n=1 Tax=Winogradskyella ludwigii TaxID=2686076 RepID=UPI0015CA8B50|nr:T9SS type A sorting domain-containing protein [Winogradskyella ludwigii]
MKNFTSTLLFLTFLSVFNLSKAENSTLNSNKKIETSNSSTSSARADVTSVIYTYDAGAWLPTNPFGLLTSVDDIIIESGIVNITANAICNTLTVKPGATLVIDSGVTLNIVTLNLNSTSQKYSSLISDGTILGAVIYHRYTAIVGTNDLISAPISGELFPDFATLNPNLAESGFIRAFAPYTTSAGAYQNYNILSNATTLIEAGKGYRAATTDGSALKFTGIIRTDDVLDIPISDAAAGNAWNLIGNPYPSYIDFDTFFSINKSQIETGSYQAIYGYDGDASNGWTVWNQATIDSPAITELIAPGQAFFVRAKAGGGLIDFTKAMRTSGSSDDFILGRTSTPHYGHIKLNLASSDANFNTDFYFNSNATQDFDAGYDTALYNDNPPELSIYSHLVDNNSGTKFAVQSLNSNAMNDIIVPLGVNAVQGQEVTFSIIESDMPDEIDIYLEDTMNNSFTLLNTSDYVFTANTNITGTGRFYLRYTSAALSIKDNELNSLKIINLVTPNQIIIKGVLTTDTTAQLYDTQGRLVSNQTLDLSSSTNTIDVSRINTGIYIINVFNDSQKITQKLILK